MLCAVRIGRLGRTPEQEGDASLSDTPRRMIVLVPVDSAALSEMPLLRGLEAAQLATLHSLLRHRTVPAGRNVMTAEEPGEVVYFLASGTAKIHVEQADGKDVILAILGPGEVLGEMSAADALGRSASVTTLEECILFWMDRITFHRCLETMPGLTLNLVRVLSRRLRLADTHIQALVSLDVYGRVARQLLAFAAEYGQDTRDGVVIPLRLTQSDLADLVGASRVRVNKVLVDYRERGYISEGGNHYLTIHDPEALAARCE